METEMDIVRGHKKDCIQGSLRKMEILHTQYFGSINHSRLFLQDSPIEIPAFV